MKIMSYIGHNRPPSDQILADDPNIEETDVSDLEQKIFGDGDNSVADVLNAVFCHIERTNISLLKTLSAKSKAFAGNKDRLPENLEDDEILTSLDLLSHLANHNDQITACKNDISGQVKDLTASLDSILKPLGEGLAALEKAVRVRLEAAYLRSLDQHNEQLEDGEKPMTSLTLRASSGAKATLVIGSEVDIQSADDIPRKFLTPDMKLLNAAIKKGEKIPGIGEKRKPSLRVST